MSKGQLYTDDLKKQIVRLYQSGKRASVLSKEYDISLPTICKWVKESTTTGSFKTNNILTEEQRELKALRKRMAELEMENDILKQAALIMGRNPYYKSQCI